MAGETTNPTTAELLVVWDEARAFSVPAPKQPSARAGCKGRRGHPAPLAPRYPARPDSAATITDDQHRAGRPATPTRKEG
jgi:hypothetical protein